MNNTQRWWNQLAFRLRVWIRGDVVICPKCWLEVLDDFYDAHYQTHLSATNTFASPEPSSDVSIGPEGGS